MFDDEVEDIIIEVENSGAWHWTPSLNFVT